MAGNWHYEAAERGSGYVIREMAPHYTGSGEIVAKGVFTTEYARLIAAAPDLLEALKTLLIPHFDENGTVDQYSARDIVGINREGEMVLKGSFMSFLQRAQAAIARAEPPTS